ncbi:efflux RND transporter permease subunit [Antarcticibacterium flavum]|uniref:Efflux RND transporter permease subunit n=1 Tax=Antarcticibacterium flavum TaxID=2058175 RepID=A0A5B7X485_9FLAO|nr:MULTISPECIES: efflux RND transporter permease subunit [Antarcticibacterium]MCM4158495.1 cation transporter [Antarcticibacterium sp. W02-3]QCY70246.1 efflux RND transporter permease subunit [Antarcticibacterium flavum]
MFNKFIKYFLYNRLVTILLLIFMIGWGLVTAPFNWDLGFLPNDPVPVDAIPDIGENQQIVFADWPGRSPQDIEDQITYPLTSTLLGISGVKSIRSTSMFGFSIIYIIFEEDVEFYWSRTRVLEKLNSLPPDLVPQGVQPALGPDATGLGQVYWYTLEGRDPEGNVTGGWDLNELRTIQDYYVKLGLSGTSGVSEVASVGGFIQEYQIDVNPDALKAYNIGIDQVMMAVQKSNRDIGAKTLEINKVEYLVRGLGYIKSIEDIENSVVKAVDNTPVLIKDLGVVTLGPAERRGILDKGGAEVVGGVVVARYGSNPLQVIENTKEKIREISPGLPQKTLADGTVSKLTIVPFYDRTGLINETLGTLEAALSDEILISIIVIIVLVLNLRASLIISSLLPIGVLITFIAMRYFGVDANVVALSGIAIAIGVMVDVGIVFVENNIRHLEMKKNAGVKDGKLLSVIYKATVEVAPAVTTALATTVVSFLPVFFMENAEGKLFRPLAFTKTFALAAAFLVGIMVLPMLSYFAFNIKLQKARMVRIWNIILIVAGLFCAFYFSFWLPLALVVIGILRLLEDRNPQFLGKYSTQITLFIILAVTLFFLTEEWVPLGHQNSLFSNYLFVIILLAVTLLMLMGIVRFYRPILNWCLENKGTFLLVPVVTILFGIIIWLGFPKIFGPVANGFEKIGWNIRATSGWSAMAHTFPGVGKEFMPSLNEGSFLLMPTSMPHAGIEASKETLQRLDIAITAIPEVEVAVGKLGRIESALDPAPISMYENVINYKSEYLLSEDGDPMAFKVDRNNRFILKSGDTLSNEDAINRGVIKKDLIPDEDGKYYRNWREHIKSPDDIWNEIVSHSDLPGVTSAPKLQPIETRLVMLQTGMRAPMGIKVYGPDLQTIQDFGIELEGLLKQVPSVKAEAVFADRTVGKPYLEIDIDRNATARYGLSIEDVQQTLETAVGGMEITRTVEGRERYPVRVRYPRELRDDPSGIERILVPTPGGAQIPLGELAEITYTRGPQMIKSEETFLVGYVLFDKRADYAEVNVVNDAQAFIQEKIDSGELTVPSGVSYKFSGNYENQVRAVKRLAIVIPISLIIIFLLLYFQFKTVIASTIHFSGVFVAFAGGFIMIWLYGQPWFMDFAVSGMNMRDLFQMGSINLSVAVWVGFIALFGIATDDGVLMGTYIHQVFEKRNPQTVPAVRSAVMEAGLKRVRPAMMTTAVTIIALFPVLTSTGKGADIMVPMAIPIVGGMVIQIMTIFVVPVLQAYWRESVVKKYPDSGVPDEINEY